MQRDRTLVPTDLILDRIMIRGDETRGQKRGIALNSANTHVRNSYIGGIRLIGQETQGIAGWNGPGPFVIENNYVEAAGIGILFGGAPPAIDQLVPSDIVIRRNHITRPVSWRAGAWVVKNLLELKNARYVQIDGNLLENNWSGGQSGFAVLFTVRAHSTSAPWTTIEHVRFENNVVRHSRLGHQHPRLRRRISQPAAARPGHPQQPVHRHRSPRLGRRRHLPADRRRAGRRPRRAQHGDPQRQHHLGLWRHAPPRRGVAPGFRFASNIVEHNNYGIFGNGVGVGNPAIATYFPGSVIIGNAIAGGNPAVYPAGNVFPTRGEPDGAVREPGRRRLSPDRRQQPAVAGPGRDGRRLRRDAAGDVGAAGAGPRSPTGLRVIN